MSNNVYEVEKMESSAKKIQRMEAYAELLKTATDKKTKDSTEEERYENV